MKNIDIETVKVPVPQPTLVVRGNLWEDKDTFLFVDKMLVCKLDYTDNTVPLLLLAAFYVFNVEYMPGCVNVFQLLEAYILENFLIEKKPTRKLYGSTTKCVVYSITSTRTPLATHHDSSNINIH